MNIHDGTFRADKFVVVSKQESLKVIWKDLDQRTKLLDTCLL